MTRTRAARVARPARVVTLLVGSALLLGSVAACGSTTGTENVEQLNRPSDGVYRTAQPTVLPSVPAVVEYPDANAGTNNG